MSEQPTAATTFDLNSVALCAERIRACLGNGDYGGAERAIVQAAAQVTGLSGEHIRALIVNSDVLPFHECLVAADARASVS